MGVGGRGRGTKGKIEPKKKARKGDNSQVDICQPLSDLWSLYLSLIYLSSDLSQVSSLVFFFSDSFTNPLPTHATYLPATMSSEHGSMMTQRHVSTFHLAVDEGSQSMEIEAPDRQTNRM